MRRSLTFIAAFALVVAACGGDDDADTTAAAAGAASGGSIVIDTIDFAGDRIVLRNAGDSAYDLSGHWLCNRPTYVELAGEVLEPGATFEVAASDLGLSSDGGEVGVYTARAFDDPGSIVRYVAWGGAGQGRQSTAADAGVWSADDFVDNGGAALSTTSDNPVSSADWQTG